VILIFVSRNNILISTLLFLVGGILGQAGYSEERGSSFLTFDLDMLYSGIPILSILVSLFVIPVLLGSDLKRQGAFNFPGVTFDGYWNTLKKMKKYTVTLVRSSMLGSIGGFVPGMSFGFSSLLAYVVERWIRVKKKVYKQGDFHCLIACESANNAGVFTQLVPLLFLGIPITASEALIYNILEARNLPVDVEWFTSTFKQVLFYFVVSSTIGLILAAKYVNFLKVLNGLNISWVYMGIMAILMITLWQNGEAHYAGMNHMIIALCLAPVGIALYRSDTTPLIFGFLLSEPLLDNLKRILVIYF